ncbi:hypothetical protein BDZ94DRAFT_1243948 [Collybia nuda]|uniref:Uncharacterized protein n=1 Tax=Collybia nuda TaxID=64659 RepID=A0A9P5YKE2_9AGAR|nr:hypothetical protein BDZ94DRAFT_1243948 [Collybia nuda]
MSRTRLSVILLSVFTLITRTASQSSNVTRCTTDYQWSLNSLHQTPCLVAAYLESACSVQPQEVNEIPPGNHYLGPQFVQADACKCSTVTYSLISACGGCQNRTFTSWANWSLNCPVLYVTLYPKPIPIGTDVPSWAYLNVTKTNNTFDPVAAHNNAANTPPTSLSASLPSNTAHVSSSSTSDRPAKASNAGAIAGGVVGGIVGLVIIALIIFWFFLRNGSSWKRRSRAQDRVDLDEDDVPAMSPPPMTSYGGNSGTPISSPLSPYQHSRDASDLGSLGSPVTSTGIYTTFGGRGSMDSIPYNPSQATRGYTGAAEL